MNTKKDRRREREKRAAKSTSRGYDNLFKAAEEMLMLMKNVESLN